VSGALLDGSAVNSSLPRRIQISSIPMTSRAEAGVVPLDNLRAGFTGLGSFFADVTRDFRPGLTYAAASRLES
jgi:hypothetical protein